MDIQYKHIRYDLESGYKLYIGKERGFTVAVEIPSKLEFVEQIDNEERKISIAVGVARCSKKDPYVKKTGRELALSRLAKKEFQVTSIYFSDNYSYFDLQNTNNEDEFRGLRLKIHKNSNRIHLDVTHI